MNPKITAVPEKLYKELIRTSDAHKIAHELERLTFPNVLEAYEASVLKWKILYDNKLLTTSSIIRIGIDSRTCGLCDYFRSDCHKCCYYTELKRSVFCFTEFKDWVYSIRRDDNLKDVRLYAKTVHDVLMNSYQMELEKWNP